MSALSSRRREAWIRGTLEKGRELIYGALSHCPCLIVGGGVTADSAVRGTCEADADRSVGLTGAAHTFDTLLLATGGSPRRLPS